MKVVEVIEKIGKCRAKINQEYAKENRCDMDLIDILEGYIEMLENMVVK